MCHIFAGFLRYIVVLVSKLSTKTLYMYWEGFENDKQYLEAGAGKSDCFLGLFSVPSLEKKATGARTKTSP